MKGYDEVGILISEAIHAVIWIVCRFFPMFGAKLLGGAVGLVVGIAILAVVVSFFFGGSSDQDTRQQTGGGTGEVIYPSRFRRGQPGLAENARQWPGRGLLSE